MFIFPAEFSCILHDFENDSASEESVYFNPAPSRYTRVQFVCQWISSLLSALSADLCVLRLMVDLSLSSRRIKGLCRCTIIIFQYSDQMQE